MRKCIHVIATAMALACAPFAHAQTTKIVVPFPPGGATDVAARVMAESLSKMLGENFIVENLPGAEGVLAGRHVVSSPPDGRTLFMGGSGTLSAPFVVGEIQPDYTLFDFTPVCGVARFNVMIVVHRESPFKTLQDIIAEARASREKVTFAYGNRTQLTIPMQLETRANIVFVKVPSKGEPGILNDVLGGHVQVGQLTVGAALPNVKAGNLRALAIVSETRSALLPDVPTMPEAGVKNWTPFTAWVGILGPRNLDKEKVERLEKACAASLKTPEVSRKLSSLGFEPMDAESIGTKGFGAFLQRQLLQWQKIVDLQ